MRDCLSSRIPAKDHIDGDTCCPGIRVGISCLHRYMVETNLRQTILGHEAAPVAVSSESDVLCCHTAQINRGIVSITSRTRRLCKFNSSTQCRIVGAVGRILDRNIFEPHTEKRLNRSIGVPYPHLIDFINVVKLILDPGPQRFHAAKPHSRLFCRVQVVRIHSRAVNRFYWAHICLVCTGSRGGYIIKVDRISN